MVHGYLGDYKSIVGTDDVIYIEKRKEKFELRQQVF
jgi:hypothetical protein